MFERIQRAIENKRIEKKMSRYLPLVPPIPKAPIEFTKQETQAYFDWYMEHIDERCQYVIEKASSYLHCSPSVFDYSYESLIPLWEWFINDAEGVHGIANAGYYHIIPGEIDKYNFSEFEDQDKLFLSTYSEFVVRDIGMYTGQVLVKGCPDLLHWSYVTKPKNYIWVNTPLVAGVCIYVDPLSGAKLKRPRKLHFEPIHMAGVQAMNVLDGTSDKRDLHRVTLIYAEEANETLEYLRNNSIDT